MMWKVKQNQNQIQKLKVCVMMNVSVESEPLTKENKGKQNNGNIQFFRKVPIHPRDCLK